MLIKKRNGSSEAVKIEKITKRITRASKDLKNVDPVLVAQKVIQGLYDGVSSKELDTLTAEVAHSMSLKHPDYDKLAVRIAISSLHKDTPSTFMESAEMMQASLDAQGNVKPLLAPDVFAAIKKHASVIDSTIDYSKDYTFDYFGFKTLERAYLTKVFKNVDGKLQHAIVERPQHMWMRVAMGIHKQDIDSAITMYKSFAEKMFIFGSPTLFNSGMIKNNMSSCFLMEVPDSISGIYDSLKETALVSAAGGGIGFHAHRVRGKGSPISNGGVSVGLVPMLKNFNECLKYVSQNSKRRGSGAFYVSVDHCDLLDVLEIRKNNGNEDLRARDLNLAVFLNDYFLSKVEKDEDWCLFDPAAAPGLCDVWGEEYERLYDKYEAEGKYKSKQPSRGIWSRMATAILEGGEPYLVNKDSVNRHTNQANIGQIHSLNLCAEIAEVSNSVKTAVCNLASISLQAFVTDKRGKKSFDFDKLAEASGLLTESLNKIIDHQFYPVEKAAASNKSERPIGIGYQGLADLFSIFKYNWDSPEAAELNVAISEAIYFGALTKSCELAERDGTYPSYDGSPVSKGVLQFDSWGVSPSDRHDWAGLREKIAKHGVRNSLTTCAMPTASTSQILGNTESFEIPQSNIFKRSTLSGEFIQINKYLVHDLMELGLWDDTMRQKIIAANGSVQSIVEIPEDLKKLYRTVWEHSMRTVIDLAAGRSPYIDQSQSMNLYIKDVNYAKLTSAIFYGQFKKLKTLMYYCRGTSASDATKVTVSKSIEEAVMEETNGQAEISCSLDNREACEACSS